jgi:neopullulanase
MRRHVSISETSRRRGNGKVAWAGNLTLPEDRGAFARVLLAYTVIMTNPGIPVIYYGDECGMPGANDPDSRRMMQCFGPLSENQLWLQQRLRRLVKIRNEEPALRRGHRQSLEAGQDLYLYRMTGEGYRDVFVMINRSATDFNAATLPAGEYVDLLNGEDVKAPTVAPPLTARVLVRK